MAANAGSARYASAPTTILGAVGPRNARELYKKLERKYRQQTDLGV